MERSIAARREESQWLVNAMPIGFTAVEKRTLRPSISVSYLAVAWRKEMRFEGR